LLQPYWQS